jgi:hypothetical protein
MAAVATQIHPVRFDHLVPCSIRDAYYRQLVEYNDTTQFQLMISPCDSERDILTDGSFDTGAGWFTQGSCTINTITGQLEKYSAAILGSAFASVGTIPDGILMKVSFECTVVAGEIEVVGSNFAFTITQSGTYEFYFETSAWSGIIIQGDPPAIWFVQSLSIIPINRDFVVEVCDIDGNVVRSLSSLTNPTYFDFTRQWLTFSYNWTDGAGAFLPEGCYYFRVADPCYCGNGGFIGENFSTPNQWLHPNTSWFVSAGIARYSGMSASNYILVENVVCQGTEYEVSYDITGTGGIYSFQVFLGSAGGGSKSADGSYTDTITAAGTGLTYIRLVGYGIGAGNMDITNLRIRPTARTFTLQSNLFSLKSYIKCSYLVSACCNEDNLLSGYGDTGFSPRVRLLARYGQGGYSGTSEGYRDSYGLNSNTYYRANKVRAFVFSAAEYIHDFMAHLIGYDHVYIDQDSVFVADEEPSTVSWSFDYDFGECTFNVIKKVELIQKRRFSDILKGCTPDGQGLPMGSDPDGTPIGNEGVPDELVANG